MADKDEIRTPEDESNIDQINHFVTSSDNSNKQSVTNSDDSDDNTNMAEEKESEIESAKEKNDKDIEPVPVKKVTAIKHKEHKPAHTVHHEEHKPIHREDKSEHVEKQVKKHEKPVVKNNVTKAKKVEVKKVAKEKPKAKKIFIIKRPLKEEKMVEHKTHKEHNKEKTNKKKFKFTKNTLMWLGIGILAAVLVIGLILIFSPGRQKAPVIANQTSNTVAATVNGENIYLQDITSEYNNLNPMVKSMYSIESLLNKSIDDILLYKESKDKGIKVTADDVQSEIDTIKTQNQFTDETLNQALIQQGMTLDSLKVMIEKNLAIRELLNESVLKNVVVTKSQIEAYYELNLEKFKVPEKVTVQHILVLITPNVTDSIAKTKIDKIQSELTSTNFCDLVTKYSDDSGSVSDCGKYTFARGDFGNPSFENPSFSMQVGEITIVKVNLTTYAGYHLIKKLESIPQSTMNLSEVYDRINSTVHDQTAQKKFDALMETLRSKATIINYVSKTNNNASVITTVQNLDTFAKCLTEKGAVFYGASWCPHCNNQKELFGDSLKYVHYVECAVEGQPQVQTQECTVAGISGYPTWTINGQSYPGEQTLTGLAKLTGCIAPQ